MKYVRTTDGRIIKFGEPTDDGYDKGTMEIQNKPQIVLTLSPFEVLKESHSIEKLCDEFVHITNIGNHILGQFWSPNSNDIVYGAIWTDKGLIYVAKMNKKGELELL